jgi:hypothetical protein
VRKSPAVVVRDETVERGMGNGNAEPNGRTRLTSGARASGSSPDRIPHVQQPAVKKCSVASYYHEVFRHVG